MPLKQLLGNVSQTNAHAGYVKRILEMLDYLNYLFGVNNRCRVDCGFCLPGFLVEGFSISGRLVILKCFISIFIFLIYKFLFKVACRVQIWKKNILSK